MNFWSHFDCIFYFSVFYLSFVFYLFELFIQKEISYRSICNGVNTLTVKKYTNSFSDSFTRKFFYIVHIIVLCMCGWDDLCYETGT